jgi:hypothetical protein
MSAPAAKFKDAIRDAKGIDALFGMLSHGHEQVRENTVSAIWALTLDHRTPLV